MYELRGWLIRNRGLAFMHELLRRKILGRRLYFVLKLMPWRNGGHRKLDFVLKMPGRILFNFRRDKLLHIVPARQNIFSRFDQLQGVQNVPSLQ